jgi:hypothetical protein
LAPLDREGFLYSTCDLCACGLYVTQMVIVLEEEKNGLLTSILIKFSVYQ